MSEFSFNDNDQRNDEKSSEDTNNVTADGSSDSANGDNSQAFTAEIDLNNNQASGSEDDDSSQEKLLRELAYNIELYSTIDSYFAAASNADESSNDLTSDSVANTNQEATTTTAEESG